jgi:histone-lysine N-methyltransferase SETMAR
MGEWMHRETVRQIITDDLGMRKISAKMVPRIFTDDQKQRRLHISSDLLYKAEMFDRVITGDVTWCFQYDPGGKNARACSSKHKIHSVEKARMSRSQFKTMLVCFFDHKGILHHEFIAQGLTANQQCYLEALTSGFSAMTMPLRTMH